MKLSLSISFTVRALYKNLLYPCRTLVCDLCELYAGRGDSAYEMGNEVESGLVFSTSFGILQH